MTLRHDGIGLYLHIPFCERRCHFCAFVTRGYRDDRAAAYVADLLGEIRLYGEAGVLRNRPVETVYFGGGTPTTLSSGQLIGILETCHRTFRVAPTAEITVEANPATAKEGALRELREGGFTRISFGAQSFDDADLQQMGAPHTADAIPRAVGAARSAGFANVNFDLIYGLPGQSPDGWSANLKAAVNLGPDHIAYYGLSIEDGTVFQRKAERGLLTLPDEDTLAKMYRMGQTLLRNEGYAQYEVSNFARPGFACRHNLGYWTDREWLGLGPGACSYLDGDRFQNSETLSDYHRMVNAGALPIIEREPGTADRRLREAVAFGLRRIAGVETNSLEERYRVSPLVQFRQPIERLARAGLLAVESDVLRATDAGLSFADDLAVAFL